MIFSLQIDFLAIPNLVNVFILNILCPKYLTIVGMVDWSQNCGNHISYLHFA